MPRKIGIRNSLTKANGFSFIILILYVGITYSLERYIKPSFSAPFLWLVACGLALIPAAVWILLFYMLDRNEPQPRSRVLVVVVVGALAGAIAVPLIAYIFNGFERINPRFPAALPGTLLIIGFLQELLKFAAIRFSVYSSSEFDKSDDGMIYGTAAGVGFAFALNIAYILHTKGASLGMEATYIVSNTLVQASFACISGYFLGRDKMGGKPFWWIPLGLILAAVFNGAFFYLYTVLTQPQAPLQPEVNNPWSGLGLAVVVAIGVFFGLSRRIERDNGDE